MKKFYQDQIERRFYCICMAVVLLGLAFINPDTFKELISDDTE